jgi:hypothetical protein
MERTMSVEALIKLRNDIGIALSRKLINCKVSLLPLARTVG